MSAFSGTDEPGLTRTTAQGWVAADRDLLASSCIGNTERRHLEHGRMIGDDVFQLGGIDVGAAGDHHVVGTVVRTSIAILPRFASQCLGR
jgi:hypothetical protein